MKINWLKLDVNILDDSKIKLIRKYPEGNSIFVLWIGIMCLGMKSDEPGIVKIADGLPYTAEELSGIFDIPIKTVQLGLELFCKYGMIQSTEGGLIEIVNFRNSQSIDEIEYQREKNRLKVAKFREKKRLLSYKSDVTVTCNDVHQQRREEKIRKEKIKTDKNIIDVEIPPTLKADKEFILAWEQWLTYRKEIRHKVTPTMAIGQLSKLEKFGPTEAIEMIRQSIENGWQGLFPVKNNNTKLTKQEIIQKKLEEKYAAE